MHVGLMVVLVSLCVLFKGNCGRKSEKVGRVINYYITTRMLHVVFGPENLLSNIFNRVRVM